MDISILYQGSQKSAEFLLLPSLTISWKLRILKRTILSHCSAYKLYRSVIEYRQSVELCWVVPISKICDWNNQVRFFLCLGAFCLFVWLVCCHLFVCFCFKYEHNFIFVLLGIYLDLLEWIEKAHVLLYLQVNLLFRCMHLNKCFSFWGNALFHLLIFINIALEYFSHNIVSLFVFYLWARRCYNLTHLGSFRSVLFWSCP